MKPKSLGAALAALSLSLIFRASIASADETRSSPLTLARALELSRDHSPLLEAARARIAEADGDLTQASVLLTSNPTVQFAAGPRNRSGPGNGSTLDAEVSLSQQLEIGGQRGHRIARSTALAARSRANSFDAERVVVHAVSYLFYEVLSGEERLRFAEENAALAQSLYEIARARVSAGAAAPIDENTARIRRAESTRQLGSAQTGLRAAELKLATALGLESEETLPVVGLLPREVSLPPLSELLLGVEDRHPRLLAAGATHSAQMSESALADAEAWPDITLGASFARDENDDVVMGGVTIPIPFFQRNQGEREKAKAAVRRADAAARKTRLEVLAEIRRAYAEYEAATRAVLAYDSDVVRAQDENLELIEAMFQAGKIQYVDVVLLQRELIEGRLGYLAARLELAQAAVAARAAAAIEIAPTDDRGDLQ